MQIDETHFKNGFRQLSNRCAFHLKVRSHQESIPIFLESQPGIIYTNFMRLIEYKHTLALYQKVRDDLAKIGFIINCVVQFFLLLYYSYAVYRHMDSIVYIILYSVLIAISTGLFVEEVIYHFHSKKGKGKKKKHKVTHGLLKILSIIDKITLLVLAIIPIAEGKSSDFDKICTIALAILLLAQIAYLFFSFLFDKYLSLLKVALQLDYQESSLPGMVETFSHPVDKIHSKFHDFTEGISGRKKEPSTTDDDFLKERVDRIEEERRKKEALKEEEELNHKKERKETFHQDVRNLFSFVRKGGIHKSILSSKAKKTEAKIDASLIDKIYPELEKKAENILSDNKKYENMLSRIQDAVDKGRLYDLSYIQDFYDFLTEGELEYDIKKAMAVNLLYFLNPKYKNSMTTKDNVLLLEHDADLLNDYILIK